MDESTFDRLTRAIGSPGTRRRLLGVVSGLGLGGLLGVGGDESTEAKRKRQTRRKHRKNNKNKKSNGKNNGNGNGGNNGGGLGSTQCVATGGDCDQDSDCCSGNCFDFSCAAKVHTCSGAPCLPPAKGCAGNTCCHGDIACDVCCDPGITQCNAQGNCCAPNCAGRQCGPDGCGNGGTCGSCPAKSTCDNETGQCKTACTPQCQGKQCGPDGCGGSCGTCPANATCNASGQCVPSCTPQCEGKQCGPDGCGGSCGDCPDGDRCNRITGQCMPAPICDVCRNCQYITVQAAIEDANGPSTIKICPGTYTESLYILRNLTLIGSGQGDGEEDTILRWPGQNGVLAINGNVDTVTLKDLHFTGATDGAISSEAGLLTMIDCTVTGNNGPGGGIQSSGSLVMTGCTVTNNTKTASSDMFGGGISTFGDASLTNCTVSGNSARSTGDPNQARGGGIYINQGTLALSNTSVTGNFTNGAGGGVYLDEEANGIVLHNNSTISGNTPDDCASEQPDLCP